ITPGKHTIVFDFKYDGLGEETIAYHSFSGIGRGGTGKLSVDGKVVATQKMEKSIPLALPLDQSFYIGTSNGTQLDDRDYQIPFPFTGKIYKLTISVDRPKLTPADVKKLKEAKAKANDAK